MAKPEWGTKRICLSCSARFYDFARSPIQCPACNAVFDLEAASRVRRSRSPGRVIPDEVVEKVPAEVDAVEDDAAPGIDEVEADADVEEPEVVIEEEEEDDEPALIEDAADLGDDDDVADVIAEDIDDEEGRR